MYKKCASWKTNFPAWRFIMWYGSIMLAQIYCPSWGPLMHRFLVGVFVQELKQPSIKPSLQKTTDAGLQ
jgi:hypothetical protein